MNYYDLLDDLDSIYDKLVGQTVTSKRLQKLLNSAISDAEVEVIFAPTLTLFPDQISVTGEYDPERHEDNLRSIVIELSYYRGKSEWLFTEEDIGRDAWRNIAVDISSVLGHEHIHYQQSLRRELRPGRQYVSTNKNFERRKLEEYYGIPDEIDAYAFTLAFQQLLEFPYPLSAEKTQVYKIYKNVFGKDHQIVAKLLKKSKTYYKKLGRQLHDKICSE